MVIDHGVDAGDARRPQNRRVVGMGSTERDVVAQGAEKQHRILCDITHVVADIRRIALREIDTVDPYRAFGTLPATCLGGKGVVLAETGAELVNLLRKEKLVLVMRAKLKITDDSSGQVCFGLSGESARAVLVECLGSAPEPYQVVQAGDATLIGLPPVQIATPAGPTSLPRWHLWADADGALALWATLGARLIATPASFWRWLEVRSGIARIVPGTWELFVPQMVNFELVGGVNFKKGCYPGQEVVARSQYLGKLKRRMFLGAVHGATPQPGSDVIPGTAGEPCGQVVLAAPAPDGTVELLFESQTAAAQAGGLTVAGAPLNQQSLPYTIPG